MDRPDEYEFSSDSLSEPSELAYSGSDWQPSGSENGENNSEMELEDENVVGAAAGLKKTRKRRKNENKKDKIKRLRNLGREYTTLKGNTIPGKKFANNNCLCIKQCFEKIPEETRKHAFESFWNLGSFTAQNSFMCGLIKQSQPKNRRPSNQSRPPKSVTNSFSLQCNGLTVNVCKKYFLETFQISDGRMSRAIKKLKIGDQIGSDKRGCNAPPNKISDIRMQSVREHIEKFPSFQSHYTREKNPNRKYLSSDLNVTLLYKLYRQYCEENNVIPVSIDIYRRTFNTEFNLHFHAPRTDTCGKCDAYKIKKSSLTDEAEILSLETDHELHLRKAELARSSMKVDTEKSKTDASFYSFTFDLEKALAFPRLTTSLAYYKRNMYVYNFGCHELKSSLGFMYAWDETIASRGSQEITSCLSKHIVARASAAEHIVSYSDTCTGQNRNWNFALFMLKLVLSDSNQIKTYDHKFMVSGHSYLPNDSDFGSIESFSKGKPIYVPDDWYSVIIQSRKKRPFHVTKMERTDFLSTSNLIGAITKRKKNVAGHPISWLKIQWIRCKLDSLFTLFYKETLNEDMPFSELNIIPSTKIGRPRFLKNIQQGCLYDGPRRVTAMKKQDMLDLLPFIPPIHHNFFKNLLTTTDETPSDDPGPLTDQEEVDEFD